MGNEMMIVLILPEIPTEDLLLGKARRGDIEAIKKIYIAYFTPVYQFIRLRVGDPSLAEDLTSEVFVKLVEALRGRSAPRQSLRGWIFRVARNVLNNHYGKLRRNPAVSLTEWIPSPNDYDPEFQFTRQLDRERARLAFQNLSAEQQEVLILRFGQKLGLRETSDIMGKSVTAVKSLQFRAVKSLQKLLYEKHSEVEYGRI